MLEVTVIGRVGQDAELKTIGGRQYASFSVASTEKTKNGDKTTWVDIMKYDENGKVTPYIRKGTYLWIRGKITLSAYNKNGETRASMTIWADRFHFCGGGSRDNQNQSRGGLDDFPQPNDDLPY